MEPRTKLALRYLSYGWSVIPVHIPLMPESNDFDVAEVADNPECSCGRNDCSYPGKHPRVNWRTYSNRLPTEAEVTEWFEISCYGSNIGVVTGSVSKLVVVDVDGDPKHFEALKLPKTLSAITGGGGRHYFYRCETAIRSLGQATDKKRGFATGIDLKAEGGFIVLPPSVHQSGSVYSWEEKMPPSLLDPKMLPVVADDSLSSNGDHSWFHELLEGVEEGGRSTAAAKLSGRYATLGLTTEETALLMMAWNTQNRPPMSQFELIRTVQSVYRKHSESSKRIETIGDIMAELEGLERSRR